MSAVDEHVVAAIRALLAAPPPAAAEDTACLALPSDAELVLREMLREDTVRLYLDYFRPVVKLLAERSVHLAQSAWEAVLGKVGALLALNETQLSWVYRAFVIKLLPSMMHTPHAPRAAVDSGNNNNNSNSSSSKIPKEGGADSEAMSLARAQAVGATLLHCAVPRHPADRPAGQEDRNELQLRRVALASLLALPAAVVAHVVRDLVRALPDSQQACVALLLNPSTPDTTRRVFAKAFYEQDSSSSPSSSSSNEEAEARRRGAPARAAVEAALRQSYAACDTVHVELLCERLAHGQALVQSAAGLRHMWHEVLQPLLRRWLQSAQGTALAASRACVRQCATVPLLCQLLGHLWLCYEEQETTCDGVSAACDDDNEEEEKDNKKEEEAEQKRDVHGDVKAAEERGGEKKRDDDEDVLLDCARGLVELSAFAAPATAADKTHAAAQLRDFLAPLLSYVNEATREGTETTAAKARTVATLPMPLLECFLLLAQRALPLLLAPHDRHNAQAAAVMSCPARASASDDAAVHRPHTGETSGDGSSPVDKERLSEEEAEEEEANRADCTSHAAAVPSAEATGKSVSSPSDGVAADFVRVMHFLHDDVYGAVEEVLWYAEQDLSRRQKQEENEKKNAAVAHEEPAQKAGEDNSNNNNNISDNNNCIHSSDEQGSPAAADESEVQQVIINPAISAATLAGQIAVMDSVSQAIQRLWHMMQQQEEEEDDDDEKEEAEPSRAHHATLPSSSRQQTKEEEVVRQLTPSWCAKLPSSSDKASAGQTSGDGSGARAAAAGTAADSKGNGVGGRMGGGGRRREREEGSSGHAPRRRGGQKRRRR